MKEVIVDAEDLVCLNKEKLQELIRCKDCKHWNANNDTHRCFVWCMYTCGDGYCHRAERKEE